MKKLPLIFIMSIFLIPAISFAATVNVLVIGGGGGSGGSNGGAGGAGGYQASSSFAVTAQAYNVVVGDGGAIASNGSDSTFDSITAIGGGRGAIYSGTKIGADGGSGGGSAYDGGTYAGGTGSQGGNGGGNAGYDSAGGGGGGAGGNGANAPAQGIGGAGGAGIANSISGSSVTYAGGGGGGGYSSGGTAGTGGGGAGGANGNNGKSGTPNTGGGAGAGYTGSGNAGGSGIVIIAYKTDGSDGVSTDSTGGTITTVGAYTIHTFTSNGTFTVSTSTSTPTTNISGTGTVNRIAKFTASTTLSDSLLSDDGSNTTLTAGNFFMQVSSLIDSIATGTLNFGTTNASTMIFGRSGQNMIINSNVGIGTSTPSSTLTVIGDMFANFIHVAANNLGLDTLTSGTLSIGSTTASSIILGHTGITTTVPGIISFGKASTISNCNSTTTPSTCGSAPAGSVALPTATSTLIVNTTAVSVNSQIFITEDSSIGSRLGITCNTTTGRIYSISARTAGTSFTIKSSANPATNKACLSYWIIN